MNYNTYSYGGMTEKTKQNLKIGCIIAVVAIIIAALVLIVLKAFGRLSFQRFKEHYKSNDDARMMDSGYNTNVAAF